MKPHTQLIQSGWLYRQRAVTRLTHWIWAICLFFLLLTGLQIFNAYPKLDIGNESGRAYDNTIFEIGARQIGEEKRGFTKVLEWEFDTTGVLGVSSGDARAFPAMLTIPSDRDLATGRIIHFFFAWLLVGTLAVWLVASLGNGHFRQLWPSVRDFRALGADIISHVRLRFAHHSEYGALQKVTYAIVIFGLFPMMILTGLSMSPSFNAIAPWLLDVLGGRQTARSLHFMVMLALVGFFVVHILMVFLAGPVNGLRSMLSGWYQIDAQASAMVEKSLQQAFDKEGA